MPPPAPPPHEAPPRPRAPRPLLARLCPQKAGAPRSRPLAAPQIARRLTASPGVGLVPSAAMGAVLLLVSDIIAQQVFPGSQLPVGTVTVSLGGLYLIYLLITQARQR